MALIALLVRIKLGSPVLFRQPRPGLVDPKTGQERIFRLCKFRTMTDEKGPDGRLLPDEQRLTRFGRWLRSTSLDELPEAFNILCGDMSVVGPRPQLVRDMLFMTPVQRMRHTARPGLSGLAQIHGRNAITWEDKLNWDLKYIEKVTFRRDAAIVWKTFTKVFVSRGESEQELDVTLDYGDELLRDGKVSQAEYDARMAMAREILEGRRSRW